MAFSFHRNRTTSCVALGSAKLCSLMLSHSLQSSLSVFLSHSLSRYRSPPIADIYRIMLCDKKYGLTVNIMATKVMPTLLPQTVNPSLNLEQFMILLEVW